MSYTDFDQLLSPVFICDKNCKINYYNHICSTFFQASPRVLNKFETLDELIVQKDFSFQENIKKALGEDTALISPEIEFLKQNGEKLTVIAKLIPLDKKNILVNILDFSIEKKLHEKYKEQISELKDTHEQILKADKLTALGEMISGISHEISSPLMIVSNRLDMLRDTLEAEQPKASEAILNDLEREFKRVLGIISGMRSFVKNQEEALEVVNLNTLCHDVLSFFEDLNTQVKISLDTSEQSHLPLVMGNRLKLQQVLINLVKNARDSINEIKANPGEIIIKIHDLIDSKAQCISVIDNGKGISEEDASHVFDMFFTTKEIDAGTGLGLAISKKIIEAHSGSIEMAKVKAGAKFDIKLPLLELGSFTMTNKYLEGEKEFEDDIYLFVSDEENKLNDIYQSMKDQDIVTVLSHRLSDYQKFTEFMMVDRIFILSKIKNLEIDEDTEDLSDLSVDQVLKHLGVKS
ncbi:MAG: hypothetical protein CME65_15045 [Halobacteriovoraceae bacterium]|nr:hypothetical protein [Halobacteriovoraceae bacterium]|tara:strand:+ start:11268 stop:12659 length:1392 start_codon:yes stop_codon:yes gene_type:complete